MLLAVSNGSRVPLKKGSAPGTRLVVSPSGCLAPVHFFVGEFASLALKEVIGVVGGRRPRRFCNETKVIRRSGF